MHAKLTGEGPTSPRGGNYVAAWRIRPRHGVGAALCRRAAA